MVSGSPGGPCRGNVNSDRERDGADISAFIGCVIQGGSCVCADVNGTNGVIDPKSEAYRAAEKRPITERVEAFRSFLADKGNSPKHVKTTTGCVTRITNLASVSRISELTPSYVLGAIGSIRDGGASLPTCDAYVRAIKPFSRWLIRDHRAVSDALAHLPGYNAAADPRLERRDLTEDEFDQLIQATEAGPAWSWQAGRRRTAPVLTIAVPDRAMLYRLAAGSGFRVGELSSLTPESFDLAANPPTVTVTAAYSKRRREDVQPIRRDLADLLGPWLAEKPTGVPAFAMPSRTADMLRADLDAANIPYADDAGRVVDFHALRHTYISRVVASGASVKVAQELARHSTPTLTIGRYSHTRMHDLTEALDNLPGTDHPTREAGELRRTGTDDCDDPGQSKSRSAAHAQRAGRETMRGGARGCDDETIDGRLSPDRKSLSVARVSDAVRNNATGCEIAAGGSRTLNLLFTGQPLCQLSHGGGWNSVRRESNPRPPAWHAGVRPAELLTPGTIGRSRTCVTASTARGSAAELRSRHLRGRESNPRPSAYETDVLSHCTTPQSTDADGSRTRDLQHERPAFGSVGQECGLTNSASARVESNHRPGAYKTPALTTELLAERSRRPRSPIQCRPGWTRTTVS